jgi:hypothetical protein
MMCSVRLKDQSFIVPSVHCRHRFPFENKSPQLDNGHADNKFRLHRQNPVIPASLWLRAWDCCVMDGEILVESGGWPQQ